VPLGVKMWIIELDTKSSIITAGVEEEYFRILAAIMPEYVPGNSVDYSNIHIHCTPIVVRIGPSGTAPRDAVQIYLGGPTTSPTWSRENDDHFMKWSCVVEWIA
jgi:hypothetical protein